MAILMNYQTLVERDSKTILCYWKYLILVMLLAIAVCAFIVSFSFQGLVESFDSCFLIDSVAFKPAKYNESHPKILPNLHFFRYKLYENDSNKIPFLVFHKKMPIGDVIDPKEFAFFKSNDIDALNTRWEEKSKCDYMSLMPVLESFVALFWLTLFFMCGRGGHARSLTFNPHPWEIVIPAIIFFALMAFFSVVYLTTILSNLDTFCDVFQNHFINTSVTCSAIMNRFSVRDTNITPAANYRLTIFFSWLKAICWISSLICMILRCMMGVDFQPVTVNIKTIGEAENGSEDTESNSEYVTAKVIKKPQ